MYVLTSVLSCEKRNNIDRGTCETVFEMSESTIDVVCGGKECVLVSIGIFHEANEQHFFLLLELFPSMEPLSENSQLPLLYRTFGKSVPINITHLHPFHFGLVMFQVIS